MIHTDTARNARFQASLTAHALERLAAHLDRIAEVQTDERNALALYEAASELAHHADALREATGLNAMTAANVAALIANPSTR